MPNVITANPYNTRVSEIDDFKKLMKEGKCYE